MTAGLRRVVCVLGDSQIHALREGSAEAPFRHRFSIQFTSPGRMLRCFIDNPGDDEAAYIRSIFFRKINAWSGPVVASLGGGEHARTWSYTSATHWSTRPNSQDPTADRPVFTNGMLETYFEYLFGGFVTFIAEQTRSKGVPGAILSFPPVLKDNALLAMMRNGAAESEGFPGRYDPKAITPADQRRDTWLMVEEAKRRLCRRSDIAYIPAPADAMEPDGFLAPSLVGDAFHANSAYGRLVLRDLAAWSDSL